MKRKNEIEIEEGNHIISNFEYKIENDSITIVKYHYDKNNYSENIAIPDIIENKPVKMIDDYAFSYVGLPNITFPKYLEKIGDCAFLFNSFRHIIVPDHVTKIGDQAFIHCEDEGYLNFIVLPEKFMTTSEIVRIFFNDAKLENIYKINQNYIQHCFRTVVSSKFSSNLINTFCEYYIPPNEVILYCHNNKEELGIEYNDTYFNEYFDYYDD